MTEDTKVNTHLTAFVTPLLANEGDESSPLENEQTQENKKKNSNSAQHIYG